MEANMGGTNIVQPLQFILTQKAKEGIPRYSSFTLLRIQRQLFLLTDGEVPNIAECVDVVRRHSNTTRVFTFGIGNVQFEEVQLKVIGSF